MALVLPVGAWTACGDDDEGTSPLDGGSVDAGLTSDAGLDTSADASVDAATSLCTKYGGAAGVERAIKRYVLEELATDCRIGLHFTMLPANRLARFSDCLSIQAQELFGCPGVTYAGSKSPNGLPCRDMKTAHTGLGLSAGDFDAVLSDVASGLLKAGVAQADIDTVAPVLLGLEPAIVESQVPTPSQSCEVDASTPVDGGSDAGG
ncbi:MAG TPA: hypothetical protein VFX59_29165 [Polyangiales bacterium]|nr:hypothetical protein [Polyangiales bacterium]